MTETALINWNIGRAEFLQERYLIDQEAIVRIVDSDMNLNPEAINQFEIDITSDSDPAGIKVQVIEASEDSGLFEGKISLLKKVHLVGTDFMQILVIMSLQNMMTTHCPPL